MNFHFEYFHILYYLKRVQSLKGLCHDCLKSIASICYSVSHNTLLYIFSYDKTQVGHENFQILLTANSGDIDMA